MRDDARERLDAHIDETHYPDAESLCARCSDEMARERGLDRDLRGFDIPDLPDHDHVGSCLGSTSARRRRSTYPRFTWIWPIPLS